MRFFHLLVFCLASLLATPFTRGLEPLAVPSPLETVDGIVQSETRAAVPSVDEEGSDAEAVPLPAPAPGVDQVRVSVGRLNVRARAGTTYEVVAKVKEDDILTVVGRHDEWLEIIPPEDTVAWCSVSYINEQNMVTGQNVRVRSGPGVVFSVFHTLEEGAVVEPVGPPAGQWQQIKVPAAATVWVHSQFTEKIPGEPESKDTTAGAQDTGKQDDDFPKLTDVRIEQGKQPEKDPADNDSSSPTAPPETGMTDSSNTVSGDTGVQLPSLDDPSAGLLTAKAPADQNVDESFIDSADNEEETAGAGPQCREGTLISLQSKATDFATHALVRRQGEKAFLICYLISDLLDLHEWENHRVRLFGDVLDYPGWRVETVHVTGIQLLSIERVRGKSERKE